MQQPTDRKKTTEPTRPSDRKTSKQANSFLKYTSLGFQMLLTIAAAGGIGYWLDTLTGWKFPVFLLTLIMVALAGMIYHLIKVSS